AAAGVVGEVCISGPYKERGETAEVRARLSPPSRTSVAQECGKNRAELWRNCEIYMNAQVVSSAGYLLPSFCYFRYFSPRPARGRGGVLGGFFFFFFFVWGAVRGVEV